MKKLPFLLFCCLFACTSPEDIEVSELQNEIEYVAFAQKSERTNQCLNFNSVTAINEIVDMENEYFKDREDRASRYYGTIWREQAEDFLDGSNVFDKYKSEVKSDCDSMHCTLYAIKGLKAGMGENFDQLQKRHVEIWNEREHAGWSIGYLLVEDWGWKAYSIIDKRSEEFEHVQKAFKRAKEYPVWNQPNIKLEGQLIRGEQDSLISQLLSENEFAWGFSDQGYHTWITRFDVLKECNWLGAPAKKYEVFGSDLFLKTAFLDYLDYQSHVLIVPPKKNP